MDIRLRVFCLLLFVWFVCCDVWCFPQWQLSSCFYFKLHWVLNTLQYCVLLETISSGLNCDFALLTVCFAAVIRMEHSFHQDLIGPFPCFFARLCILMLYCVFVMWKRRVPFRETSLFFIISSGSSYTFCRAFFSAHTVLTPCKLYTPDLDLRS